MTLMDAIASSLAPTVLSSDSFCVGAGLPAMQAVRSGWMILRSAIASRLALRSRVLPRFPRHPQGPFGNDVALYLAAATVDGIGTGEQEQRLQPRQLIRCPGQ